MKRWDALLFFLVFAYLLGLWTGFWTVQVSTGEEATTTVGFEAGILETLRIENAFLDRFQDPLLESDARPDRLFEAVHRDLTRHLVLAIGSGFLLIVIPLAVFAGMQGRWFYGFMKRMVFLPVALFLLLSLLFTGSETPPSARGSLLLLVPLAWKSLLLFLCTAGWMQSRPLEATGDFLTHLKGERLNLRHQLRERIRPLLTDLATVMLIGAAITNVVLLPFFQLQLLFSRYFAFLLIPAVVLLAAYYVRSYRNVAEMRGDTASWSVSVSFLAFRMMRNLLFLSGMMLVVVVALVVIFAIIYGNLSLLRGTGIIKQMPGL